LIEEGGKPLPVAGDTLRLSVGHHAIETIKCEFGQNADRRRP
jgi:hypothetical protein